MTPNPCPALVRSSAAAILCLVVVLFAAIGPASAQAPVSVDEQIADNAKVLGTDRPRVEAALDRFNDKTGIQLYVVYVKSFDGMSGADWARKTAAMSTIGATDILMAVSTSDGHYGVAEPRDHALSTKDFSAVATKYIRPAANSGDWAGAAIDAARGYQEAYQDSGLPWSPIVTGIIIVLLIIGFAIRRSRRTYDRTHEVRDEHGKPVDPLELLRTHELIERAKRAVDQIQDPVLKDSLTPRLNALLAGHDSRDTRRALAINIIHGSKKPRKIERARS